MTQKGEKPENDPIESKLVREDPSFADIVLDFVQGLERRIQRMEEAIQEHDLEALRQAAHQLKGSGGGYGYPALTERAATLERQAKAKALDDCRKTLDELRELCQRLVVQIE